MVNSIYIIDYTSVNKKLFTIPETFISYISLIMGFAPETPTKKRK